MISFFNDDTDNEEKETKLRASDRSTLYGNKIHIKGNYSYLSKKKKKKGGSEKLLKVNNNKNCFGFSSQTHYTIIFLLLMMIFQENECNSCSQIHSKHIFYLPNKQKANNISINRCNLNLTLYTYILLIDKKLGKG